MTCIRVRVSRIPLLSKWDSRSFGILRSAERYSLLPTFRYTLSVSSLRGSSCPRGITYPSVSGILIGLLGPWRWEPIGCTETSVRNYNILCWVKSQKRASVCYAFVHFVSGINEYSKERAIKSRRMRWAGHVAPMGESRDVYWELVGKPEGERSLRDPRRIWEDNIKMDPGSGMWGVWTGRAGSG